MHHLMLITLSRPAGATSQDTRERVRTLLLNDDSFCGGGGRFGAPLCDWFVIGGRWSGHLKKTSLGEAYSAAFKRAFPEADKNGVAATLPETSDRLNELWRQFGGTDNHPATRSGYDELGSDDDAMIVDPTLYTKLLAQFQGESQCVGNAIKPDFTDLDDDPVGESFIGRKWIVAIDYHN